MNNINTARRTRITRATIGRFRNMKMLIDTLKLGPMSSSEIGDLLLFTPSGVRKYLYELVEVGAAKALPRESKIAPVVYMLISHEKADEYLMHIDQGGPALPPMGPRRDCFTTGARRVSEGVSMPIKAKRCIVPSDPITDALFGRAPATDGA